MRAPAGDAAVIRAVIPAVIVQSVPGVAQAVIGAAFGARLTWVGLQRGRAAPADVGDEVVAWSERPLPIRRQDRVVFAFLVLHGAAHVALALLALRDGVRVRPPATSVAWYWVAFAASTFAWLVAGVTAGFVVLYERAGPASIGVRASGLRIGARVLAWDTFARGAVDAPTRVVRLYGARLPEVAHVVVRAPSEEALRATERVLSSVLPPRAPGPTVAAWRWSPVAWLAVVVLPPLVGAWLVAGRAWSGAYLAVATYAMLRAAPELLRRHGLA